MALEIAEKAQKTGNIHDIELEAAVLGAVITESPSLAIVTGMGSEDLFFLEKHQLIYRAVERIYNSGEAVDLLSVTAELRKSGELTKAGGPLYITQLSGNISSSANIETHTRYLQELHIKRRLYSLGAKLWQNGRVFEEDVFEALDFAQAELIGIMEGIDNGRTLRLSEALKKTVSDVSEKMTKSEAVTGVPTPFTHLNQLTSGWQKSDLIIIAARPSMGKSALLLNFARSAAMAGTGVGIFELEMSTEQMTGRLIVQETHVCSVSDLRKGKLSQTDFEGMIKNLNRAYGYNLHIDDTPSLSVTEFRSKAWRLKTEHNIGLIIVDYLQLMTGDRSGKGTREQEISSISRALKKVAKELDIPVIALSQLSRAVEQRGGEKRPMLSDLRESGAIEQDADIVGFIYRPEHYGIKADADGNSTAGTAELIIAKNRNGALGTVDMNFIPHFTDFAEPAQGMPEKAAEQMHSDYRWSSGFPDSSQPVFEQQQEDEEDPF